MTKIAHTAQDMISSMTPEMRPETFVFVTITDPDLIAEVSPKAISTFQEDEGMSMLISLETAEHSNLSMDHPMRCITLNVYSSLDGVGLTAAVATALGEHGIACNMVAAFHHDHVFVPAEFGDQAMDVLTSLQNQSAKRSIDKA